MPLPLPKIVYGTGSTTLQFTYPPIQKPQLDDREVVRHDSMTASGLRQVAVERVDIIKNLQMEYVPWEDLSNWEAFIDFALLGGQFAYYPDADSPNFQTFELMDTTFAPKFNVRGITKFTLKLRLVPDGDSYP